MKRVRESGIRRWVALAATAGIVAACSSSPQHNRSTNPSASMSELSLGSVQFSMSSGQNATASAKLDPGSVKEVSLSVKDAQGYTWTLVIAPDSVSSAVQISMTALNHVHGPSGLDIATGVQISPSGLSLGKPAEVYATAPVKTPSVVELYSADSAGGDLMFAPVTRSGTAHLLGSGIVVGATHTAAPAKARSVLVDAQKIASAQAKLANRALPDPPAVTFTCGALPADRAIFSFVEASVQPEAPELVALAGAYDSASVLGVSFTGTIAVPKIATSQSALVRRIESRTLAAAKAADATKNFGAPSYEAIAALAAHSSGIALLSGVSPDQSLAQYVTSWHASLAAKHCAKARP